MKNDCSRTYITQIMGCIYIYAETLSQSYYSLSYKEWTLPYIIQYYTLEHSLLFVYSNFILFKFYKLFIQITFYSLISVKISIYNYIQELLSY